MGKSDPIQDSMRSLAQEDPDMATISLKDSTESTGLATLAAMERENLISTPSAAPLPKIVGVMPAYNASATLERTLRDIPTGTVQEVILVDDCSSDNTVEIARSLGLTVIEHQDNRGYGGNQKTCYAAALERDADVIVMIHPDYQYDSRVVPLAAQLIHLGICDCILGSRIRSRAEALQGGMPRYKYICNRVLTTIENIGLGQNLGDFHSGFRAYSRRVLETIPFERNSDDFVFDSQFLVQVVKYGFKLGDIPVPVRYFDEASSINFRRSLKYGLQTLQMVGHYWTSRLGIYTPHYLSKLDAPPKSN